MGRGPMQWRIFVYSSVDTRVTPQPSYPKTRTFWRSLSMLRMEQCRRLVSEGSVFVIVGRIAYQIERTGEEPLCLSNCENGYWQMPTQAALPGRRLYDSLLLERDVSRCHCFCKVVSKKCCGNWSWQEDPIQVSRPFQILGIDIMTLMQDLFTKWPFAFLVPDPKTERIARLMVEEVIPCFGIPVALLSDRGTNLLSHLMLDMCKMLGIDKTSTTAYHRQCDGAVERFNRTLKKARGTLRFPVGLGLSKHTTQFNRRKTIFPLSLMPCTSSRVVSVAETATSKMNWLLLQTPPRGTKSQFMVGVGTGYCGSLF